MVLVFSLKVPNLLWARPTLLMSAYQLILLATRRHGSWSLSIWPIFRRPSSCAVSRGMPSYTTPCVPVRTEPTAAAEFERQRGWIRRRLCENRERYANEPLMEAEPSDALGAEKTQISGLRRRDVASAERNGPVPQGQYSRERPSTICTGSVAGDLEVPPLGRDSRKRILSVHELSVLI
jgi:hypothetical protein